MAPKDTDRNIFDPLSSDSEDGKDDDNDDDEEEEEEDDRPGRKVKFSVPGGEGKDNERGISSALAANGPRTSLNNPTSLVQQRLQVTFPSGASQQDPPPRRSANARTIAVAPPSPQMGQNGGLTSPTAGPGSAGRGMMSPSRAILVGSRSDRRAALPEVGGSVCIGYPILTILIHIAACHSPHPSLNFLLTISLAMSIIQYLTYP